MAETSSTSTSTPIPVELYRKKSPKVLEGAFWVPKSSGSYPANSIKAGKDLHGINILARVHYNGGIIPGKLFPQHGGVDIADGDKEIHIGDSYEVLTAKPGSKLVWLPSSNGHKVENAVVGGKSDKDELLFIGRAKIEEKYYVPGKIVPSELSCFIPWKKTVQKFKKYEILVALGTSQNRPEDSQQVKIIPKSWKYVKTKAV